MFAADYKKAVPNAKLKMPSVAIADLATKEMQHVAQRKWCGLAATREF
ncbi:hypothetical protein TIFTF001_030756 [Ficus carica]|uniref:Uncharacterized protein n=1 Tax=Ficus carica TaxID=3494 RepID=A0AA88DU19_FICCA|nr:hypothetical protein TIFTF001_030756 [Ficus carica]